MKPILTILAVLSLALVAPACGKKKEGDQAPPPAASKPTAPDPAATPDPAAGADEAGVPTVEDFEEQAEQEIGAENLEEAVGALEEEVGE